MASLFLILATLSPLLTQGEPLDVSLPVLVSCDNPGVDPWVLEMHERVVASNQLAAHAISAYGPTRSCEGAVLSEFDGIDFGVLSLRFAGGVTFRIETMPPEIIIVTLRTASGFDDGNSAGELIRAYSADVGLGIDWTAPEETIVGGERVETFRDPDPGLNGSASLIFRGSTLVAVRSTIAP